jgi:hypothetical protein
MLIEVTVHNRRYRGTCSIYRDIVIVNSHYGDKTEPRGDDAKAQAETMLVTIVSAYREFYCA